MIVRCTIFAMGMAPAFHPPLRALASKVGEQPQMLLCIAHPIALYGHAPLAKLGRTYPLRRIKRMLLPSAPIVVHAIKQVDFVLVMLVSQETLVNALLVQISALAMAFV